MSCERCERLEAALRTAVAGLSNGACYTCGSEPGCNIDCPGCLWIANAERLLRGEAALQPPPQRTQLDVQREQIAILREIRAPQELIDMAERVFDLPRDPEPPPQTVAPRCVGYPTCDGDLVATPHEPECPAFVASPPEQEKENAMALGNTATGDSGSQPMPRRDGNPMPPHSLHRCRVCGTIWRLWDDSVGATAHTPGGGWSLVDNAEMYPPGPCCDNVAMGEQIEQIYPAVASPQTPARPDKALEDYRAGYSTGYEDGKTGEPFRDEELGRVYFAIEAACPACGCEERDHRGILTCRCPEPLTSPQTPETPAEDDESLDFAFALGRAIERLEPGGTTTLENALDKLAELEGEPPPETPAACDCGHGIAGNRDGHLCL